MNQHNEGIFFAAFFFPSAALAVIFGMKYLSAFLQARVRQNQDDAYRFMAAQAAASQAETATALSNLAAMIADVQTRLAGVETILKAVE